MSTLGILDILIALVLAGGLVRGFSTGVIRQVASLLGLLIGFALAAQLMDSVGEAVAGSLGVSANVAPLLGFILVLIVVQIAIFALTRFAETLVGALKLSFLNRIAGGVFGAFKAAVVLSVVFMVLGYFEVPDERAQRGSTLYDPVAAALPQAWNYAAEHLPTMHRLADRFTQHVEEQLPESGN